ncbi:MAG: four-carbon acid sugar kinase family protein [Bryobacteraceae bacterium]
MMSRRLFAIADDLTGALEIGAIVRGVVQLVPEESEAEAIVFDAETRHLSGPDAYNKIKSTLRYYQRELSFKKTDSTLRGPIAAEFRAILDTYPDCSIVFAPAYPQLGRTVKNGILYVDGKPLQETGFANDPVNPIKTSNIGELLADVSKQRVIVCDAETQLDLEEISRACSQSGRHIVPAGAAAFARCLFKPVAPAGKWLVLVGSLHNASRNQVVHAELPTFDPDEADGLAAAFKGHDWCVLTTRQDCETAHAARALAQVAVSITGITGFVVSVAIQPGN